MANKFGGYNNMLYIYVRINNNKTYSIMTKTFNTLENLNKFATQIMKVNSRVDRQYAEYLAECWMHECDTVEEMENKIKTEA